jgi:hypothetical protein
MQPLPMLTMAQVKLLGPLQPAGNAFNPALIDKFVAMPPSSVMNVTVYLVLNPTATLSASVVEGMATMLSLLGIEASANLELTTSWPQAANNAKVAKIAE